MQRCDFCFKVKATLQAPIPDFPANVCKGCYYEIDRVIGFLAHYGYGTEANIFNPPTEDPPKPPQKAPKKQEET